MDQPLFAIGIILIVLAYLIGIKKQVWLLSGYNQKRVKDKDKLAKLLGGYNLLAGLVLVAASFIGPDFIKWILGVVVIGYLLLVGYVNTRMVE